jgi:REP element-mobilizing transposase RayT
MRERIREIIVQTCAEMGVRIMQGVRGQDHAHIFLWIQPRLALSNVMQRIKGRSSQRIQMEIASASEKGTFGPEVISQPHLEMSLPTSSRSIWNYIPLNNATGVSR